MGEPESGHGLFASLRQLLATAIEIAAVRLALLSTEIEQEKLRLFDAVLWAGLALILLTVGVLLLSAFIVLSFWESYRLPILGALTVLYLGGGVWLMRCARQRFRSPGGPFGVSVAELEADRAGLKRDE
jgi:uncharacterized membrane protein YqjE